MSRSHAKRAFRIAIRPVLRLLLGLRVVNRAGLPARGPAIVVANHNSHLDTIALMSLFPREAIAAVRPAAAADHFGGRGLLAMLARTCLDIIPVERHGAGAAAALAPVVEALNAGAIVIFFPEGSRGQAERIARFRRGIAHLASAVPQAAIVPVHLRGFGKAMPRGSHFVLPTCCEAIVGDALDLSGLVPTAIPPVVEEAVTRLGAQGLTALWDDGPSEGDLRRGSTA